MATATWMQMGGPAGWRDQGPPYPGFLCAAVVQLHYGALLFLYQFH